MTRRWRTVLLLVAAAVVAADLWTKALFDYRQYTEQDDAGCIVGDWLCLAPKLNEGAIWSLRIPKKVLLVITALAVPLVLLWLFVPRSAPTWDSVGKCFILGGALGNLHDRARWGAVRDFIDVYIAAFDYHYPTFNIADAALVTGIVMLLISSFRAGRAGAA